MLKRAGFFVELTVGPHHNDGSICDAVRAAGLPDEAAIVGYLRSGRTLVPLMEAADDVITGEGDHPESLGAPSLYTDGVWMWRRDLAHYVRRHHVVLPEELLMRIRGNDYEVPVLSRDELLAIEHAESESLGRDWWS